MSGSVAGSIPYKKTSLVSRRRYRARNFTDVIVNTMSNMSGMRRSAANKLPHKEILYLYMPKLQKGNIHLCPRLLYNDEIERGEREREGGGGGGGGERMS